MARLTRHQHSVEKKNISTPDGIGIDLVNDEVTDIDLSTPDASETDLVNDEVTDSIEIKGEHELPLPEEYSGTARYGQPAYFSGRPPQPVLGQDSSHDYGINLVKALIVILAAKGGLSMMGAKRTQHAPAPSTSLAQSVIPALPELPSTQTQPVQLNIEVVQTISLPIEVVERVALHVHIHEEPQPMVGPSRQLSNIEKREALLAAREAVGVPEALAEVREMQGRNMGESSGSARQTTTSKNKPKGKKPRR